MREQFTRAWWQVLVGAMVVGSVVGLGIGVIVGSGIGGTAGSPARSQAGSQARSPGRHGNGRPAGTVSKRTTGTTSRTVSGRRAAARSACGRYCLSLFSQLLGPSATMSVVPGERTGAGARAGSPLGLIPHGLRSPDGQFTISLLARVAQFCGSDKHDFYPPTGYLCKHESGFRVVELAWSPLGNQSGLCVGVPVSGRGGESLVLRPCGVDPRTVWIADQFHRAGPRRSTRRDCVAPGEFCPLVSGADFNFTRPFVLTVDSTSRSPADQLKIERLALVPGTARGRPSTGLQEFSFTSPPS